MIEVHKIYNSNDIIIETIQLKNHDVIINEPHTHTFWEIGYFEVGGGKHSIDFNLYPIENKMLYLLKKGIVHKMQRSKGSYGKVLMFDDRILPKSILIEELFYTTPHLILNDYYFNCFKELFLQLETEVQKKHNNSSALIIKYLELLLTFYAQFAPKLFEIDSKLQQFLHYVENHYSAKLTVEICCNELNMSYHQLHAETKNKLNKLPMDIVKERVILEAKRLLYNTTSSVKEIAYQLSFEDASYFTKYFKSFTGLTPLEFRNKESKEVL